MTSVQTVDAGLGDRRWLWLTVPIGLLLAGVSLAGLLVPDLYRGAEAWIVQAIAQDFVDLVLVLPVLALGAWRAGHGSHRGWLIWLGTLTYLVYTFVIYAFAVPHNRLFLAYVAVLGGALWALIGGMATTDWRRIRDRFGPDAPVRWVGFFLAAPAVLFLVLWLADELPALATGQVPISLRDTGLLTNPVHVLDFVVMLPAMLLSGLLVWRRHVLGYGLAEMMMVNALFQNLAIACIMVFALRAGLPGAPALVALFLGFAAVNLATQWWYLRPASRHAQEVGASGGGGPGDREPGMTGA